MSNQSISRIEQLQDPAIIGIVDSYIDFVNRALAAEVYPTLYGKYPSLKEKVDAGEVVLFDTVFAYVAKIVIVKEIQPFVEHHPKRLNARKMITIRFRNVFYNLKNSSSLILEYAPKLERFLLRVARSINSLTSNHQVSVEEILANQSEFDEVTRMALPSTREASQQFYEDSVKFGTANYEFFRLLAVIGNEVVSAEIPLSKVFLAAGKIDYGEILSNSENLSFLTNATLLPTKDEAQILESVTLEYLTQQLDRIYGTRL